MKSPIARETRDRKVKDEAEYCLFSFRNRLVRSAMKRKDTAKPKIEAGMRYFCAGKMQRRDGVELAA